MDGSAGGVAYRPGSAQLLHDRLFEFGELHSSGANAGNIGSGADDTNQRADSHRGQLSLGFCRGDILRIPLSRVWVVVIRCSLSRQFFAGTAFSSAYNICLGMSGNPLGKFCDGFQARGSVRYFSRHRFGTLFRSLFSDSIDLAVRRHGN